MALFSRLSPEEKAEQKQQKEEAEFERLRARKKHERERQEAEQKRKEEEAFRATPAGQARTAKEAGRVVFQYLEALTETTGIVIPMVGAYTTDEKGFTDIQSAVDLMGRALESAIEQIESEGWRMIDAGYVFQQTSSESRDKFLASGQQEAISGRVLGIYTFRIVEESEFPAS